MHEGLSSTPHFQWKYWRVRSGERVKSGEWVMVPYLDY